MYFDHFHQLLRDDAFAAQFGADKYQTFVAVPFCNRRGYPEPRIKKVLLNHPA